MTGELTFGLVMAAIGIATVFSALVVVALATTVLKKLFKQDDQSLQPFEQASHSKTSDTTSSVRATIHEPAPIAFKVDQRKYQAVVEVIGNGEVELPDVSLPLEGDISIRVNEERHTVVIERTTEIGLAPVPNQQIVRRSLKTLSPSDYVVRAPMGGNIIKTPVEVGSKIEKGTVLVVLESMKMENSIESLERGIVSDVAVTPGDVVKNDDVLVIIRKDE